MKKLGLAIGLAALLVAGTSRADDTGSLEGLLAQEVVTTASKSAEQGSDAPALVRNITAEEIHRYGMTSLAEALTYLGVGLYSESRLGVPQLTVRGVTFTGDGNDHVLLLLDGHALNDPLKGSAHFGQGLAEPLEMIDHIELVLGPGSAVHGSNAMLAVVNIVTKSAKTMAGTHVHAEAGAIGTLRATATNGSSFDLLGKRTGVTTGVSFYRLRGTIDLAPENIGVDSSGGLARFSASGPATGIWGGRARNSYRGDALGAHVRVERDGLEVMLRSVFTSWGDPASGGDFDDPDVGMRDQRTRLSVKKSFALGTVGEASVRLFGDALQYRHIDEVSRATGCHFPNATTCRYRDAWEAQRAGTELQSNFDWLHDGKLTTVVGGVASYDHVEASNSAVESASGQALNRPYTSVDVNHAVNLAGYGQQHWRPLSWLDFNAGARIDWRTLPGASAGDRAPFHPEVSPRLAVTVKPWEGATLRGIYAQAFRAPSIYELHGENPILLHAASLQPEHARSYEVTFEQQLRASRVMFGVFHSEYRGLIGVDLLSQGELRAAFAEGKIGSADATTPVSQYRAEENVTSRGFHAGADTSFLHGRLRVAGNVTGAVARSANGEPIEVAPQFFGNARASYELGGKLPTVALASIFAGRTLDDLYHDKGFSSYASLPAQLEMRATATGAVPGVRGLRYRVIGTHVFNSHTPFSAGPALRETATITQPFLVPTKQWNAILGLSYEL